MMTGKVASEATPSEVIQQAPVAIGMLRARMREAKAYNKNQAKTKAKAAKAKTAEAKTAEVAAAQAETK